MAEKQNKGVGVIITNKKKDRFFIQQKDNDHPIKEFRLKYCFFGGALEDGEDEEAGLSRELSEEINEEHSMIILKKSQRLFESTFNNLIKQRVTFVFYESILSDKELMELENIKINEGRGELVGLKEMYFLPFLIDLEHMLRKYLWTIR